MIHLYSSLKLLLRFYIMKTTTGESRKWEVSSLEQLRSRVICKDKGFDRVVQLAM